MRRDKVCRAHSELPSLFTSSYILTSPPTSQEGFDFGTVQPKVEKEGKEEKKKKKKDKEKDKAGEGGGAAQQVVDAAELEALMAELDAPEVEIVAGGFSLASVGNAEDEGDGEGAAGGEDKGDDAQSMGGESSKKDKKKKKKGKGGDGGGEELEDDEDALLNAGSMPQRLSHMFSHG